mmetsp:Transcript_7483/g.15246  ORF Transcript_7483/g.15246 Transcript_7483/m.15246 type:complete len:133 (+) Transcript_7483:284-682(+)
MGTTMQFQRWWSKRLPDGVHRGDNAAKEEDNNGGDTGGGNGNSSNNNQNNNNNNKTRIPLPKSGVGKTNSMGSAGGTTKKSAGRSTTRNPSEAAGGWMEHDLKLNLKKKHPSLLACVVIILSPALVERSWWF